jgi:hypothetical protein
MKSTVGALAAVLTLALATATSAATVRDCAGGLQSGQCGSLNADQAQGDFHGLIMSTDDPSLLDRSAHAGSQPGCGDCEWTIVLACPGNPVTSSSGNNCGGGAPRCKPGQSLFRLFLTTSTETNVLVAEECLGGVAAIVPVGQMAAADVQRYLKEVDPPDLVVGTSPPRGALVNLATYFAVKTPTTLQPQPFGGGQISETITIEPMQYDWRWGDGTDSGWTADPGAPYPDGNVTHTYEQSGRLAPQLTTRWGGTYTVTIAGQTFGPYNAIGTVDHTQTFPLTVYEAHSQLVSHG